MDIYVLIEPLYEKSFWCKNYIKGMRLEAGRQSSSLVFIKSPQECLLTKTSICVILGSTPSWLSEISAQLGHQNIRCIAVNLDILVENGAISRIHIDYHRTMQMIASYFATNGKKQTVLFGVNPSSSTDKLKADAFGKFFPCGSIFLHKETVSESCEDFTTQYPLADSVLCCNELVAYALIKQLQKEKRMIPEEIWLVSFGGSSIVEHLSPTLTIVDIDYEFVGVQIVKVAKILQKNQQFSMLCCSFDANLKPADTTNHVQLKTNHIEKSYSQQSYMMPTGFYQDPIIIDLLKLDHLFANMLPNDTVVLHGLYNNNTYAEIAEIANMSENSIKYRVKRMMGLVGTNTRKSLLMLIKKYINREQLK